MTHFATLTAISLLAIAILSACGGAAEADGNTWRVTGPLLAWESGIWVVGGVPIVVPDDIASQHELVLGSTVTARGVFDDAGRRVADDVAMESGEWPDSTLPETTLVGKIERVDGTSWTVDGRDVIVATGTIITASKSNADAAQLTRSGTIAEVSGNITNDNRIVAREIILHDRSKNDASTSEDQSDKNKTPSDDREKDKTKEAETDSEKKDEPSDDDSDEDGSDDDDD